ncbi:TPA: thaumatin domain-containing protein [Legionella pneumophila subsp. pneumophila]|nr:Dot/Icm T4SS effector LegT [Legionella pneumophila]HAT8641114.1 thaumatin domain-containing protein [Legionella pneumophila]HAT8867289.1 thaumatin domain-containing protein [Legionella pneumophila subsp. pneumophila]HAT8933977.1 thaumatin domain-containing protein [Legionella pneumophila subsp. pneumophila]
MWLRNGNLSNRTDLIFIKIMGERTNMKYSTRIIITTILLLFVLLGYAGKDPISWRVSGVFPAQSSIGQTYTVTYTFTNQLPFRLAKALIIERSASPNTEFNFNDQCSGRLLNSGESCEVVVALNPLIIGLKTLQLTIAGYSKDRVPLPQTSTLSTGQSLSPIVSFVMDGFPSQLTTGSFSSYKFTFTNNGAISATNLSVNISQSLGTPNFTTTCNNTLTPNGGVCEVDGTYTVTSGNPSIQQVTASLSYTGPSGSPVTAKTFTQVVNPAAPLVGTLVPPNYLPPLMIATTVYTVQFLFTASGTVDITNNGTITCLEGVNNCNGTINITSSSCTPQTLTNAACQMTATFTAPAAVAPPLTYTLTATVPYSFGGNPQPDATAITFGTVLTTLPTERTVTLVNECDFNVWFSLNGSQLASSPNCPSTPCPNGSSCNTSTNKCFWNNPSPNVVVAPQAYLLTAAGGTNNVTIPVTNADPNIQWSGNISASTLCNGTTCQQAACGNNGGTTSCAPGIGFTQPATQAEITMNLTTSDSYDVEVINGFHIPISMQPIYYQAGVTTIPAVPNNYNCGEPGKDTAANGFGACDWDTATVPVINQVPGNGFYWVTGGGQGCSITSTNPGCPAMTLCGLDSNFNQVCGNFLGYWSSDQVCGSSNVPASVQSYFKCNQPLPTSTTPFYPSGAVLSNLMLCSVPKGFTGPRYNTCYNAYPSSSSTDIAQCCGCADWWNPAQTNNAVIGANPNTESCTQPGALQPQTNAQWNSFVQPMIQWMKQACPSAYIYPFDDKTSGFTCTNNLSGQPNSTSYIIRFCPGGKTGLPNNITDGRI